MMELPVFFIEMLSNADLLTLNEDTSRHVVQVLRMKPTEQINLTDGAGNLLTAVIIDDHKKKCTVKITDRKFVARKERQVCVAISLLKNASRFEWFLEKATEIGVTEIIPLLCERTEKQHFRFDRMRQIVISAMMQSKQFWLPDFHKPQMFEKIVSSSNYSQNLIAHCGQAAKTNLTDFNRDKSVQIFIGPEGDFSDDEIHAALEKGFAPVSLGDTRLRTETAGIVAATLLCN